MCFNPSILITLSYTMNIYIGDGGCFFTLDISMQNLTFQTNTRTCGSFAYRIDEEIIEPTESIILN